MKNMDKNPTVQTNKSQFEDSVFVDPESAQKALQSLDVSTEKSFGVVRIEDDPTGFFDSPEIRRVRNYVKELAIINPPKLNPTKSKPQLVLSQFDELPEDLTFDDSEVVLTKI